MTYIIYVNTLTSKVFIKPKGIGKTDFLFVEMETSEIIVFTVQYHYHSCK